MPGEDLGEERVGVGRQARGNRWPTMCGISLTTLLSISTPALAGVSGVRPFLLAPGVLFRDAR